MPLIPLVFSFLIEVVASQVSRCILLIAVVGYYLMGAKIFQVLETDKQEELRNSFLEAKAALMKNYACITSDELEIFLQVRDKGALFLRVINVPIVWKRAKDRFYRMPSYVFYLN